MHDFSTENPQTYRKSLPVARAVVAQRSRVVVRTPVVRAVVGQRSWVVVRTPVVRAVVAQRSWVVVRTPIVRAVVGQRSLGRSSHACCARDRIGRIGRDKTYRQLSADEPPTLSRVTSEAVVRRRAVGTRHQSGFYHIANLLCARWSRSAVGS